MESVAEILKYILSQNLENWVWIDQLCINQAELVDRSARASMMGQFYSSSSRVGLSPQSMVLSRCSSNLPGLIPIFVILSPCAMP